jgi:hypothetical protein
MILQKVWPNISLIMYEIEKQLRKTFVGFRAKGLAEKNSPE